MAKLTTLELSQTDRNLLDAIKLKTGMRSNAEVLRSLIRKGYSEVADKSRTRLAKEKFTPGKSMLFKLVQMRVIKKVNKGGKLSKTQKLRKLISVQGEYMMSDGTIVKIG